MQHCNNHLCKKSWQCVRYNYDGYDKKVKELNKKNEKNCRFFIHPNTKLSITTIIKRS